MIQVKLLRGQLEAYFSFAFQQPGSQTKRTNTTSPDYLQRQLE